MSYLKKNVLQNNNINNDYELTHTQTHTHTFNTIKINDISAKLPR